MIKNPEKYKGYICFATFDHGCRADTYLIPEDFVFGSEIVVIMLNPGSCESLEGGKASIDATMRRIIGVLEKTNAKYKVWILNLFSYVEHRSAKALECVNHSNMIKIGDYFDKLNRAKFIWIAWGKVPHRFATLIEHKNEVLVYLKAKFANKIVSKGGDNYFHPLARIVDKELLEKFI